jgi:hypothetical protein
VRSWGWLGSRGHFPEFLGAGTLEIKRAGLPRAAAFAASAFGVISFRASMITLFH